MTTKREKNPRFEVYPTAVGVDEREWRWCLYAKNGEILASGEGFTTEKDARRSVAAVKRAVSAIMERDDGVEVLRKGTIEALGAARLSPRRGRLQ